MGGFFEQALEGFGVPLAIPDLWQQEAIRALEADEDVVLSAPTGAGKTLVFETLARQRGRFGSRKQAVYTVPTRALANEKWRQWRREGWKVGIATGDLALDLEAPVLVATLETQRERLLAGLGPALLVIDEYQMIADARRGLQYELAVALAPESTRLLLLSGSVGNPARVVEWLQRLGRRARLVETKRRPVPLEEIPWEALPRQASPREAREHWQRLALAVLLSQRGPLLVFAPHRRAAEKIAARIAEALPEDDPVRLGDRALEQLCSKELARLLKKRIAFHHSGLGYAERAAIVEPLAKAGQLRVVVATMGLAAGINFSVRSVHVAETRYQDGPFEREVGGDELLQMYGRAGRRGLDEIGYVVTSRRSPQLGDAHPLELRRQNQLDWPTLLRRMHLAATSEPPRPPAEAARELCERLFSRQRIRLGFAGPAPREAGPGAPSRAEAAAAPEPLFGLKPTRREILNSRSQWEARRAGRERLVALKEALTLQRECYRRAEADSALLSSLLPPQARLCRLDSRSEPRRYGAEIAVARREAARVAGGREGNPGESPLSPWIPTRAALPLLGQEAPPPPRKRRRRKSSPGPVPPAPAAPPETAKTGPGAPLRFTLEEAEALLPGALAPLLAPALPCGLAVRGDQLFLLGHFAEIPIEVYLDELDAPLHQPKERREVVLSETHLTDGISGESIEAAPGTAVHAWRSLRLIEADGAPTRRGILASFFQGGEGLAVAAALEDPTYPTEDLVLHLANLRAGHRFELDSLPELDRLVESLGSERLASACREAYGPVDHEGYLRLGLPEGYGEGAAEVISALLGGTLNRLLAFPGAIDFGLGDVERACVEWLSLLRHIAQAPEIEDERWLALRSAAAEELRKRAGRSPLAHLPELPASVLQAPPRHGLRRPFGG